MRISERRMAEIGYRIPDLLFTACRHIFCVILLLFIPWISSAQKSPPAKKGVKKIEILNADLLRFSKTDRDLQILTGNVKLKHNDAVMTCDSAYYYQKLNQVKAFSRVHIEQGDTLDLMGDYIFYDGKTEFAQVDGNVELVDKETHLFTKSVTYDFNADIARYTDHGRIINGENTLTSIIGIYFVSQDLFHFKDSVKVVNPDYVMTADTMDYNTESETAFFTGPSELKGDSLYLYCERGWYDTKKNNTSIWKNAVIDNRQQIVHGDSLYYDDNTGYGESFRNISIADTTYNIIVKGEYAWYYKTPERFMVTDSAVFIQISSIKDSLFLHADTIKAVTVSDTMAKGYRLMRAFYKCRVFSDGIQAKCDSLSYSFQDSVIRLYYSPVLWSEENQLTSDSMAIFTKNRQADRMELYNSVFVVSQVDTMRFNQIKGRKLLGYFRDNKLYRININGNGESLYYLIDKGELVGVNKGKCADIDIFIENGDIKEIYQNQNPEGVIDPPSLKDNVRLSGFNWFDSIRPKQISDIFKVGFPPPKVGVVPNSLKGALK
jgi:lipopolysaccharide export system protein LptA